MKLTIKRGRKTGDPNYSSTDVGLELTLECDDELYYDRPAEFTKWAEAQWAAADTMLETEIKRIYASRQAPVETAAQRDERRPEPATSRAGYQNGDGRPDGELDRARSREEPAGGGYNGNGNGYNRQSVDYGSRNSGPPGGGQYRAGGGGKSYGPPKSGGGLIAWAKELEEKGEAKGLSKWIMYQWGKRHGLGDTRVVDWPEQAVRDCYDEVRSKQENGG